MNDDIYDYMQDTKYTLYGGTKVIQTRNVGSNVVKGLVIRTNFFTLKGNLVRDILYPKGNNFKFYQDSLRFIAFMAGVAILGFLSTVYFLLQYNTPADVIDKSLDLITITVPPALPAAMTVGTVFAISRLKKKKIFCISPPRVNVAGRVNLMVFDKTGTLTEDGLEVSGYRSTYREEGIYYHPFSNNIQNLYPEGQWWQSNYERKKDLNETLFVECMATCHSITRVHGDLIGDPLDVKMFHSTGFMLEEITDQEKYEPNELITQFIRPSAAAQSSGVSSANKSFSVGNDDYHYAIVRTFDFSSKLQRMSVITRQGIDGSFRTFVKGSPEKIMELCRPDSIPGSYIQVLNTYTSRGYRVLALATRSIEGLNYIKAQNIQREEIENNLDYLGLLIMENKLKEATKETIQTLNNVEMRTIMATGDNIVTAIAVGKDCNIIEENNRVFMGDLDEESGRVIFREQSQQSQNEIDITEIEPDSPDREWKYEEVYDAKLKKSGLSHGIDPIVYPWQHPPETYSIAITGKAFNKLVTDNSQIATLHRVLFKAQIYARMSPDDKAILVEQLQSFCQTEVGMCGDGANDCGALKQADVGISLSEAEASIAAPFTSQIQDISAVIEVFKEGRCSLTTSFQTFKYVELYSMIQFATCSSLYAFGSNLGDWQFLFQDLLLIVPLSMFMGHTGPYKKLTRHLPTGRLVSAPVLSSVIGAVFICLCFQMSSLLFVHGQDWFKEVDHDNPEDEEAICNDYNSTLFFVGAFQLLITCIAFSISRPFRKPLWTNPLFLLSEVVLTGYTMYLLFMPSKFELNLYQLKTFPLAYKIKLLILCFANGIVLYLWEKIGVWQITLWRKRKAHEYREALNAERLRQLTQENNKKESVLYQQL